MYILMQWNITISNAYLWIAEDRRDWIRDVNNATIVALGHKQKAIRCLQQRKNKNLGNMLYIPNVWKITSSLNFPHHTRLKYAILDTMVALVTSHRWVPLSSMCPGHVQTLINMSDNSVDMYRVPWMSSPPHTKSQEFSRWFHVLGV